MRYKTADAQDRGVSVKEEEINVRIDIHRQKEAKERKEKEIIQKSKGHTDISLSKSDIMDPWCHIDSGASEREQKAPFAAFYLLISSGWM